MEINIVVAHGLNGEIGKDNKLLWDIPNEMKRFVDITKGKFIIMGNNTYKSLGRPLPNRTNIIISKSIERNQSNYSAVIYNDIDTCLRELTNGIKSVYIIGGASIYKQLESIADILYISEIQKEYPDADTHFKYDLSKFDLISEVLHEDIVNWKELIYKRKQ